MAKRTKKTENCCFAACLSSKVLKDRHKYKPVDVEIGTFMVGQRLPKDTWEAPIKEASMSFDAMVGTSQTAPWWSPSANTINSPSADLHMWRDCKKKKDYDLATHGWETSSI